MTRQCYCGEKLDAGLVINETDVSKRLDKNPCSLPPPPLLPITNSLAHTPSHATQKRNMLQTFLNVLSMSSNFLASSGSWALMSPPMKMLSRYIHFLCTTIHTWEGLEKKNDPRQWISDIICNNTWHSCFLKTLMVFRDSNSSKAYHGDWYRFPSQFHIEWFWCLVALLGQSTYLLVAKFNLV